MKRYEGKVVYQIFVRNYKGKGTFKDVIRDLDRIRRLGVDIIYLMPIHEIGLVNRKGTFGSPYSIKDYYSISKDLGSKEDLLELISETHKRGMRIITDMVFNHTSRDSVLLSKHPDFYFLKDGRPANRVGDWSDIYDLNTSKWEVQKYLIDVLKYWVKLGFDGFRFDVASMIPVEFFNKAREALGKDVIFFAESISGDFHDYLRANNIYCSDDYELLPSFDFLYNYNYYQYLRNYLKDNKTTNLKLIADIINKEFVENKDMLRANCLENHDNDRVANYLSGYQLMNFYVLSIFLRGVIFIYAGEEYGIKHKPELFEKDMIDWSKANFKTYYYFERLIRERKTLGEFKTVELIDLKDSCLFLLKVTTDKKEISIIFNLSNKKYYAAEIASTMSLLFGKNWSDYDPINLPLYAEKPI